MAKDSGFVTPTFALGAVLVQDESGHVTRLSWEDEKDKERKRFLTPGKYAIRGYRLIRTDRADKEWIVSASGHNIKELTVEPGKETRLAFDESVFFGSGMTPMRNGSVNVMMHFKGEGKSGMTVYAAGKRIPVTFRLLDASGKEVASGSMTYG